MKKHFFIFTLLVLSVVAISTLTNSSIAPVAVAGSSDNISGFAWSSNIGWISFNSTNCDSSPEDGLSDGVPAGCPAAGTAIPDYGVNIAPLSGTGIFSGYAWSENIGWIDFAPAGPYPEAPNNSAQINWTTGDVTGWARALSYGGGWDGWIKLSGTAGLASYGVTFNSSTNEFEGYAWGSDVIGWIDFNSNLSNSNGGPLGSVVLTIPNDPPLTPDILGPVTGIINTSYSFTASSTDPNGDDIRYRIDWDNDFNIDESTGYGSSGGYASLPANSWSSPGSYTFNVLAEDVNGAQSAWGSHTIVISNPQCNDGSDNDGDGWTDYPNDPGCSSSTDNSESPNPQCSDLVDNDGDGNVDLADAGCTDIYDSDESNCGDLVCNGDETYFTCPGDGCSLEIGEF